MPPLSLTHKHTFKYAITNSTVDDVPTQDVVITVGGDATLPQLLELFDRYIRGCGYFPPQNHTLQYAQDAEYNTPYSELAEPIKQKTDLDAIDYPALRLSESKPKRHRRMTKIVKSKKH